MLQRFSIENFILIDRWDLDFYEGFTAITGETGAGKSILLKALGILLGDRVVGDMARDKEKKVILEADFLLGNEAFWGRKCAELDLVFERNSVVRRVVGADKRSRIFWNDEPISLQKIRLLAPFLVDIYGQHDAVDVRGKDFAREILDEQIIDKDLLSEFFAISLQYKKQRKLLEEKVSDLERLQEREDFFRHQLGRFEQLDLSLDELRDITVRYDKMQQFRENASSLQEAREGLDRMLELCVGVEKKLGGVDGGREKMGAVRDNLGEVYGDVAMALDRDFDPGEMDFLEGQMQAYYGLLEAFSLQDSEALIAKKLEIEEALGRIALLGEEISSLEFSQKSLYANLLQQAEKLSLERAKIAKVLSPRILGIVRDLGMEKARFEIVVTRGELVGDFGLDRVDFLFSANPEQDLQPLGEVASGGELSRVMLALKSICCDSDTFPTVIFDEIDTGVSGKIAEKMGIQMRNISGHFPVLAITHLPQVASLGDRHLQISKVYDGAQTIVSVDYLDELRRVEALAYMLSGENVTDEALSQARKMRR